ncbi:DUF4359 domain-containing protein [Cyanobium sp. CH-040]|uniref:DUF4359 domain-containing protein n=1 Tax=Cyanobium sp. CH-040 TaxID=2823708 RepID=UPI0020CE24C7|nr:DUF4359 domain-containing protein [Cyanobium sp. CH-040]MCP9926423.1 DUF4359 domain-containing protein [Cyanobium sp. CH-040]
MRSAVRGSWLGGLVLTAVAAAGLALSNPKQAAFERFAAAHLVDVIEREVCEGDVLPPLVRLALPNCAELVQAQNVAIGALVSRQTRRWNLGVCSLYRTDVGGQQVLVWQVPRFRATVLGVAGRFLVLHASVDDEGA